MAYRLPPLTALRAFESAARYLSFTKAAAELHVTPAAISQQVKTLESYLGLRLFLRLARRLELTSEAEAMLPKLREAFENIAAAVEMTRIPGGTLMITAPPNFAARWLIPRLSRFTHAHPEVETLLSSSLDALDRADAVVAPTPVMIDPRNATTGVTIRFGAGQCEGQRVDFILAPEYTLVCCPALLTGERPLRVPDDLRWHELIQDEAIPGGRMRPDWEEWLSVAGVSGVDASKGQRYGNSTLAIEAALAGQGVVLAPAALVASEVSAGRLVVPFDIQVSSRYFYYLVAPEAIADRPAVVAFRNWLMAEATKDTAA